MSYAPHEMLANPGDGPLDATRPLGVYIHFPFCSVRCPYCDFAVDTRPDIPHAAYGDAVIAELNERKDWFAGGPLKSIYFGGGTPGLWRALDLQRVREAVGQAFRGDELEITVEANPGELTPDHLRSLRAAGVNRLSLGVQSVDDDLLVRLGRNHRAGAGPAAIGEARAAGFDNVSCDLIYGVPGQTLAGWRRALDEMVALGPEHVSAYALTIERGTAFGALDRQGKLARPGDEEVAEMFALAETVLGAAGYEHYEISSYARPGRRAVHNGLYWSGGAYLGLGASAASFRPLADGTGWRFSNPRATETYLRGGALVNVERRPAAALENEALWLALRTADGVDRAAHARRYGADPLAAAARAEAARRCMHAGWLAITGESLRLTPRGFLFADEVAERMWL